MKDCLKWRWNLHWQVHLACVCVLGGGQHGGVGALPQGLVSEHDLEVTNNTAPPSLLFPSLLSWWVIALSPVIKHNIEIISCVRIVFDRVENINMPTTQLWSYIVCLCKKKKLY